MGKSTQRALGRINRSRRRITAATDTQGKIESRELPARLEFARRTNGRLPETVTAGDLETLNLGLHWLFASLRRAHRYFQNGEGNGRGGAVTALGALQRFIMLFESPLAERLHAPILDLRQALGALENNNVSPMLKPVRRRGRAKSSDAHEALKGRAAGTVQLLLGFGVTPADAHRRVAKVLGKLSVRPERGAGGVTPNTVRHWCDDVATDTAADLERRGVAAIVCRFMFNDEEIGEYSDLPSNRERQDRALALLADFVREFFPEMRRSQKPS